MGEAVKPVVVISGVNFIEGGPLSVMKDAIAAFIQLYIADYSLMLLVNDKKYFPEFAGADVTFYEYPAAKKSWIKRLWFEYVKSKDISKSVQPYLWLAMHDITPNVSSPRRAVYCHNPAPFYKVSKAEAKLEPSLFLFSKLYTHLYRINIRQNNFVIVQQDWLRQRFLKDYGAKTVVVAHPDITLNDISITEKLPKAVYTFLYPAFPRVFKNFEVLLKAVEILSRSRKDFQLLITIDGKENKYAALLKEQYVHLPQVKFLGLQPRHEVLRLYGECDALVFPSKLETWGLPISEAKLYNKPMLVADKQYAYETVGAYKQVKFFDVDNAPKLSAYMDNLVDNTLIFDHFEYAEPPQPFVKNWKELMKLIMN